MECCLFPNQLGYDETNGTVPTLCEVLTEGNVACTNIDLNNNKIINSSAPTNANDLATKAYVDSQVAGGDGLPQVLNIDNNANQNIEMNGYSLINVGSISDTNGNITFSSNIDDDIQVNTAGTGAVAFKQVGVSGTANPLVTLESQSNDAPGVYLQFYKNSTTPTNNDRIGVMSYYANNSVGAKKEYARLRTVVRDATENSEDAELDLLCMVNGSIETILACTKDGIDVLGGIFDVSGSLGSANQVLTSGTGSQLKWATIPTGAESLADTLTVGNDASGLRIVNLGTPVNANDATTKNYVDTRPAENLATTLTAGNSAGGNDINMNGNDINNCDNIYVTNNVECNDLVMVGLAPTISNSLAGATITMTANGKLSLLSALGDVTISAPQYVSIGSAGYTTIENLHIDNSVITKEGAVADLQFQNIASISNSATSLTVQDTEFGSNYVKPSKIRDASNNVGNNQVLTANASGQLVWKTETIGAQSLAQVLAVGNDCSGSAINGITYLNGGQQMYIDASGQLFIDANESIILNSGATHPIELNSLGDVTINTGNTNSVTIDAGTDISLQVGSFERVKIEIAEVTVNVPLNPSEGIYDSTGSLGYNKMLTADASGQLVWATQLGLQNLESVLANGNTSGAYSISMVDGSGNRQNITEVQELDVTDAKITTIKAGVGALVDAVNFDTNIFINSTLPIGVETYSVVEFAGDGFINANGEITMNPVDLTLAPSSKLTDVSGRVHIVADNDSNVSPVLLLKSENDTNGGVYQRIAKQNTAPFGSVGVSEVEYLASDSSGNTRQVCRKVMNLTTNSPSNYTCEELYYFAENADNSFPDFKLSSKGFGATAGNLGYAGNSINDNLVYNPDPSGSSKFVSNARIKPVVGIEESSSTSIGASGQILSSTGTGVQWVDNCADEVQVNQLTIDGGGYCLFVDGSGCKTPQFATGLEYVNDFQKLIVGGGIDPNTIIDTSGNTGSADQILTAGSSGNSLLWQSISAFIPIGTVLPYAGSSTPSGWLLCNGGNYSTTGTYANLYAVIGNQWGGTPGNSFNVPNLDGNLVVGTTSTPGTGVGTLDAYTNATWQDAHTHNVDPPVTASGAPSATTTVQSGTGATVATSTHTHSTNIASFNSGSTTVDLSAIKRTQLRYIIKF